MKILVIDDEEDVRYIARISLERLAGMTVFEASSGEEGVALAKSVHPDCILLDVMMPDMDGEATFAELSADGSTASIPVVFLPAVALTQEVQRVVALGVRGVIRKPFNPKTLAQTIRELLRSSDVSDEGLTRELQERFRENTLPRLEEMRILLRRVEAKPSDRAATRELLRHFHFLSGMGATCGFPQTSAVGEEAEGVIGARLRDGSELDENDVVAWRALIDRVEATL